MASLSCSSGQRGKNLVLATPAPDSKSLQASETPKHVVCHQLAMKSVAQVSLELAWSDTESNVPGSPIDGLLGEYT